MEKTVNKETIQKLENLFNFYSKGHRSIKLLTRGIERIMGDDVDYTYQSNFTHPQLSNEMLYIGHFLDLPFCLDLGCPGAVHVLTGNRAGLVDEWDWFKSFGEALKAALAMSDNLLWMEE